MPCNVIHNLCPENFCKCYIPGSRTKKVALTEIVDKLFQWDVLKNMRHIKSDDGMFQAIRALTVHKILKMRI